MPPKHQNLGDKPKTPKTKTSKTSKAKTSKAPKGGADVNEEAYTPFVFLTKKISTQQNTDPNYEEVGIIHVSQSSASGAARSFVTDVSNVFGAQGFENAIFDQARNLALKDLATKFNTETQKVCNLRMDIDMSNPNLVMVNCYGTLLERIPQPVAQPKPQ